MWEKVCDAFEAANEGVTVELTIDKNLEDVIDPAMKAGDYPDVIMRAVGAESGMTETFIRDNNLTELTDVLDMTVPGEEVTVGEKILPGFTENTIVNPYGDGKTYLMPMFYGPCGLFYNAGLFEEKAGKFRRHGMRCGNLETKRRQRASRSSHIRQPDILMHSSMHCFTKQWEKRTSQRL